MCIKIYLLIYFYNILQERRNEYTDSISCSLRSFVLMLLLLMFLVSSKRYIWVYEECGENKHEATWIVKIHNSCMKTFKYFNIMFCNAYSKKIVTQKNIISTYLIILTLRSNSSKSENHHYLCTWNYVPQQTRAFYH